MDGWLGRRARCPEPQPTWDAAAAGAWGRSSPRGRIPALLLPSAAPGASVKQRVRVSRSFQFTEPRTKVCLSVANCFTIFHSAELDAPWSAWKGRAACRALQHARSSGSDAGISPAYSLR